MGDPAGQDQQDLGRALRALRNATGRSLDDVARLGWADDARLTGSQVGQIERGVKRPTLRTLLAILRGLDVEPADAPPIVRLQLARGELDEREVGLAQALHNLERFAPDPAVEEAEAVREFVAAYDELRESGAAPPARAGRARPARRRRAAS